MNLVGKNQLCDGYLDRRDGTDETNCPYLKESPRFETSECTFDSNSTCHLQQAKDDEFDWILFQGATPSSHTGPGNTSTTIFDIAGTSTLNIPLSRLDDRIKQKVGGKK